MCRIVQLKSVAPRRYSILAGRMFQCWSRRTKTPSGNTVVEDLPAAGKVVTPKEVTKEENMAATNGEGAAPLPMVVCGPSGVGKGTLINMLLAQNPKSFGFSVSHTTRGPREGEVDGQHYNFTRRSRSLRKSTKASSLSLPMCMAMCMVHPSRPSSL